MRHQDVPDYGEKERRIDSYLITKNPLKAGFFVIYFCSRVESGFLTFSLFSSASFLVITSPVLRSRGNSLIDLFLSPLPTSNLFSGIFVFS